MADYIDYHSKRTGKQIEDLLDQVESGNTGGGGGGGGGVSPDLSIYATKEELNGKVDKVDGKQLSTEDFTTALKDKLNSLNNYDDSAIQQAVNTLREDFNTLVSGDTTTAIKSFNDIIAFLNGIEDSESLDSIIAGIQLEIAKKQVELVSGVNIKTINGQSILGSGNIQIESDYSLPAATTTTRGGIKIGSGVIINNTDVLHAKVNESTGLSITNNGIEIKLGTGLKVGNQNRIETNLKTINGQPIEGSGNIEIQGGGGSNTFIFDWDGTSTSGDLTEEMFNNAMSAERIIVREIDGDDVVRFYNPEYITKLEESICAFAIHNLIGTSEIRSMIFLLYQTNWEAVVSIITIPTKTSQLTNDSNFVKSNNLKTINGNSIVGSGNITIGDSGGSAAYPWGDIEGDTVELLPNTYYTDDRGGALNVILGEPLEENVSEYVFCLYNEGVDNLSVSFEENIFWANGAPPFNPGCYTEVSIIDYRGVWVEFKDA